MDKLYHFGVCLIASFLVGVVNPFAGATFAAGLGLGKEYGDSKAKGNRWDWLDIVADAFGMVIGTVGAWLLRWMLHT